MLAQAQQIGDELKYFPTCVRNGWPGGWRNIY